MYQYITNGFCLALIVWLHYSEKALISAPRPRDLYVNSSNVHLLQDVKIHFYMYVQKSAGVLIVDIRRIRDAYTSLYYFLGTIYPVT